MKQNQIILFDLDGTLIDSTEAILESFDVAFGHFGAAVPPAEKITAEIGHPLDRMFLSLGISEAEVWEYVGAYKSHYRQISRQKTILLPEAEMAVKRASEIARLGVVTTKTGKFSIELLEHMNLMHYFEVMVGREDVENPKPHPEPIFTALSKFKMVKNKCWMIGDTCMDMLSAKEAGVTGIAVTSGYGSRQQLLACSSLVTENALDAVSSIEGN
ncbi:MAG: HAD family hydrolase [Campylobacterota bacterium]|nr:HAD family hydrolase [Campylobacterota bacterium]